jgi:uncharacterized protein (TIGR02001 family)
MNKLMLIGLTIMSLSPFANAEWDVSGSIGVVSEYFYRGESQGDGSANQMNLHLENSGWFGGIWLSQVEKENANWEHDFYGGYEYNLSDNMSVYGGVMKYDFDHEWLKIGPDTNSGTSDITEAFVGGTYKSVSVDYYMDLDNSDLTFLEVNYMVPLGLADIDLMVTWGRFDSGEDVFGLKGSKSYGPWKLSAMVMEHNRHGTYMNHNSLGLHYNF